ncbi:MAG: tRNA pseudouridine(38-40) synthase TruA [Chlamydiota bacterium]
MFQYRILISYDGAGYYGWQKACPYPSIERSLQGVLEQILQEKISLQAASRTDRGVHAKGQVVTFNCTRSFDRGKILCSINRLLSPDIRALSLDQVLPTFHPSLDAQAKTYLYQVYVGKILYPHERFYFWHYPGKISEDMQTVFPLFLGRRNFNAFSSEPKAARSPECNLHTIQLETIGERWYIRLKGDRFLYKMVRIIVGTLMNFSSGKLSKNEIIALFSQGNRADAGISAPAHGLFLEKIHYE